MATKKKPTKSDLEAKIAELEAKLSKLASQVEAPPKAEAKPAPPPKAEAKPAPPPKAEAKPAPPPKAEEKPAPPPKPAETAPKSVPELLEETWQNVPIGDDFAAKKAKTPAYTSPPNRYFARRTAPVGKVPTSDWNMQKAKTPAYTQPSNQYFATRARMAYHPHDKSFTGYGLVIEVAAGQGQAQVQTQAPPPPPKKSAARGSLPKGF